jgi:membrane-associated phospholipid phosphatase
MLHDLELEFIRFLHQFRNPFLDQFFKSLDFFDRSEFFFLLIPIIWLGNGWKAGLRLFYIMFLSSVTNQALKALFLSPRPYHLDPSIGVIEVSGLGFPSGAAQTVILLSGILLTSWKSPWRWPVVFTYILFVSFSRIYLGLHFPSDISAGWIVGAGLWAIYTYIFPVIETKLKKLQTVSIFLLSQIVPLLLLTWQTSLAKSRICGSAMGIGIGLLIAYHYKWLLPPFKK